MFKLIGSVLPTVFALIVVVLAKNNEDYFVHIVLAGVTIATILDIVAQCLRYLDSQGDDDG